MVQAHTVFETARGSKYFVTNQFRTQRNKSLHLEHGTKDVGWKEPTDMTVYVSSELAKEVAPKIFGSFWLCFREGGLFLVSKLNGQVKPLKRLEYSSSPEIGLCPVDFWKFTDLGYKVFYPSKIHVGNQIVSIQSV